MNLNTPISPGLFEILSVGYVLLRERTGIENKGQNISS